MGTAHASHIMESIVDGNELAGSSDVLRHGPDNGEKLGDAASNRGARQTGSIEGNEGSLSSHFPRETLGAWLGRLETGVEGHERAGTELRAYPPLLETSVPLQHSQLDESFWSRVDQRVASIRANAAGKVDMISGINDESTSFHKGCRPEPNMVTIGEDFSSDQLSGVLDQPMGGYRKSPLCMAVAKEKMLLNNLPYDILFLVCNQIMAMYSDLPRHLLEHTRRTHATCQDEVHILLDSSYLHDVIFSLNATAGMRALSELAAVCKSLHINITMVKQHLKRTNLSRLGHRVTIEALWFEDLAWFLDQLNHVGLAKLSALQLSWDNVPGICGYSRAKRKHRTDNAAVTVFRTLADDAINLRSVRIKISPKSLHSQRPNGSSRSGEMLRGYRELIGMAELKEMVEKLRTKGGRVAVALTTDMMVEEIDGKLVEWLNGKV